MINNISLITIKQMKIKTKDPQGFFSSFFSPFGWKAKHLLVPMFNDLKEILVQANVVHTCQITINKIVFNYLLKTIPSIPFSSTNYF